jgi:hypothetical protein
MKNPGNSRPFYKPKRRPNKGLKLTRHKETSAQLKQLNGGQEIKIYMKLRQNITRFFNELSNRKVFRLLLSLLLIVGVIYLTFLLIQALYALPNITSSQIETVSTSVRNVSQTIFFLITAILGILSYQQARKSLFSPIRTEIFKMQINVLEKVLLYFQDKAEHDFIEFFDLDRILYLNATHMIDEYLRTFFGDKVEFDEEAMKKRDKPLVGGIFDPNTEVFVPDSIKPEVVKTENKQDDSPENPALQLASWQKYKLNPIEYTDTYFARMQELEQLMSSPLMPGKLREILLEFSELAHDQIVVVGQVITRVAQDMPTSCKTVEEAVNFNSMWVWNEYNEERPNLEEKSNEILDYVRQHLRIDRIMD